MVTTILICSILALLLAGIWVRILDDDTYSDEANFCRGCTCIWCDAVPRDDECEKWRDEHGNENT